MSIPVSTASESNKRLYYHCVLRGASELSAICLNYRIVRPREAIGKGCNYCFLGVYCTHTPREWAGLA